MRYSQEKRSYGSKPLLIFINLLFSSRLTIYIFSSRSSSPLLVFSSDVSTTSLHTSSLHSSLAYLPACPSLLLSRKNINRLSLFLFSRTVFPNCKLFATYLHMYLLKRFLSTQANMCIVATRFFGCNKSCYNDICIKYNISIVIYYLQFNVLTFKRNLTRIFEYCPSIQMKIETDRYHSSDVTPVKYQFPKIGYGFVM